MQGIEIANAAMYLAATIICNGQYWLPPLHITQYAAAMPISLDVGVQCSRLCCFIITFDI